MWSVGLLFLHGALDSHPFFPSRAASRRCVLAAAAACVPTGVASASAEPSSWHTGVVLVGAGVVLSFLLPTPLRTRVVHPMPRRVSVCVRPNTSIPPSGVLVVHPVPPGPVGLRVGRKPPATLWVARVHGVLPDGCGRRALLCAAPGGVRRTAAAPLSLVQPTPVLSRGQYLSSTALTIQTARQGPFGGPKGAVIPCAHQQSSGRASTAPQGALR